MELTFYGFDTPRTVLAYNPGNKTLGDILGRYGEAVEWCRLDGDDLDAWQDYIPQPADRLALWMRPGWSTAIIAGGVLTWGTLITQVAIAVISFAITYGLGLLLANRQDPTQSQAPEQTFGVAGLSNTIVLGTPKFVVYGERRVFGHIIATEGGGSDYSVLYFMGEGEIADLRAVEINEIPIAEYPNTSYLWRKGTDPQDVLPLFERPIQVYSDGRQLLKEQPVVYQAHGDNVTEITVILSVPYLQQVHIGGEQHTARDPGWMDFRLERKRLSGGQWQKLYYNNTAFNFGQEGGTSNDPFYRAHSGFEGKSQQLFFSVRIVMPEPERWQVRVTLIKNANNDQQPPGTLFNAQEVRHHSGDLTYPHNALLAIYGVASAEIQSFESMKVSALVKGRLVKTWNGATYRRAYTRNRAWVVRDILTEQRVGMGHRIPESLWNDAAALDVATYYNATIEGEARDLCDVVANQRRPAVDWVRDLLTEGNAAVAQSNGKLKLLVDKSRTPVTGYLEGNVVRESVQSTLGSTGTPPNTVRGEFPDAALNYRLSVIEVTAADIGAELPSEQTVSLQTVTRLSEATRKLAYALKKTRLVQRRFTWQSPLLALPSEPFDVVRLSYATAQHLRGWGGFIQAGTTALNLVLDRLIPLEAGETYEVIVRTLRTNEPPMVRTFIATATRGQTTLAIAPALPRIPQPGDLYAIGLLAQDIVTVLLEHSAFDSGSDLFTLSGSEYRAEVYDTSGTGAIPSSASTFRDFPALYSEDAAPRYHATYEAEDATGRTDPVEPWPGAQLWRSLDPSDDDYDLSYQGAPLPLRGTAVTVLPAAQAQTTDLVSEVEVAVTGGRLTTITSPELQMGFNYLLLGGELLNARVVVDLGVSGGFRHYRLRHLRRGRRGTELAVSTHTAGEPVLLLGTGVFTQEMPYSERHRTRRWKTPTIGQDVTEVPYSPYAVPSRNLVPWTVGSARGVRLADGTWMLTWYGRARFYGEWLGGTEATPDYDFVDYELRIYRDASRTVVAHLVQQGQTPDYQLAQQYQYTFAQQTSDFGSGQTTLYWTVLQRGVDDTSAELSLVSVAGEGT